MKILAYSYRLDETDLFDKFSDKYKVEVELCKDAPNLENAHLAKDCECISIVTTRINAELMKMFYEVGVRYISTRTIGYEHIDIETAHQLGIGVSNVSYSPSSVAEYTVMLMLMALRKVNNIIERSRIQDFSLKGLRGKEIHNLTVGVIGTGKIGQRVIKNLSGFGCKILAYDFNEYEEIKSYAEYVKLEELYKNSDIITLHVPAREDNFHMINNEAIKLMKEGVILINTSRGSLIHTEELIQEIERGKIGGAGLDVFENEPGIVYKDLRGRVIKHGQLAALRAFPNVVLTPHTAFYTDEAVSDMVENSIKSCVDFMQGRR